MQSSLRPLGCACNCPPPKVISLGPKGVPYQLTSPLNTKYTLPQLFYFMCRVSYEHGQKKVPKTMNQLKRLSIPSELLRFFNHFSFPHKGHPTSSMHPPWTYTTYDEWTWPKESAKDQGPIKEPKHPRNECLDSLTTFVPHEWAIWQGQRTPPPTNIHNMHLSMHFQHHQHFISMTSPITTTTSFHIDITINNNINSCWHDRH